MGPLGISLLVSLGIGIVGGLISENQKWNDANKEYFRMYGREGEDGTIDQERKQKLEELAKNYEIEKEEVNNNATTSEGQLNNSAKLNFDNLINNMTGQAEAYNIASMNAGQNKGNELSQMAASGARSSSMQQAVELESAVNQAQIDLQEKQNRNNNTYQINSLLNNINNERINLQNSRRSFEEGGTANKKYKASVDSINNAYDRQKEELKYQWKLYDEGTQSRAISSMLGIGTTAFGFTSSIDTSKINFSNFGSSESNGQLKKMNYSEMSKIGSSFSGLKF